MVGVVSWSIANMHDAWWELLEKDAGVVLLEGMSTIPQELRDRVEVSPPSPIRHGSAMAQSPAIHAVDVVRKRSAVNEQLPADPPQGELRGHPLGQTDRCETAALVLRTTMRGTHRRHLLRAWHGRLLADTDAMYQGCGASYPFDPHVLEVDHINPWSQGGTDASESLTLLCPPGNRENRDLYTLFGLHAVNLMAGNMKNEANLRVARASRQRTGRRRRL